MNEIAKSTVSVGSKMGRHTKRLQGAKGKPTQIQKIAANAASDMDEHAAVLEAKIPSLRNEAREFGENYAGYLETIPVSETSVPSLVEFRGLVEGMGEASKHAREQGVSGYRNSIMGLRNIRISQAVNQAADRLGNALDDVIDIMKDIERSCQKLLNILDSMLEPFNFGSRAL